MNTIPRALRAGLFLAASLAALPLLGAGSALAGSLDRIKADATLRVAFREDAPPFSYTAVGNPEPVGYMVELCRAVGRRLAAQIGVPSLKIAYVPVTAANRFEAIEKNDADLLCEATSVTLSRRQRIDFSIPAFVDGASLMTRDTNLRDLRSLSGKKIGVLGGTTTETGLMNTLRAQNISAEIVQAKTHAEGLALIDTAAVSAYFADRTILMFLLGASRDPAALTIAENYLTVEPYALGLPLGDTSFRLAVDAALSHIYRSGEVSGIFNLGFGPRVQPTEMIKSLYLMSGLPD